MGKLILVVGGVRSGKSKFGIELAKGLSDRVGFIATGIAGDAEMRARIEFHKKLRPREWETVEEPRDIKGKILRLGERFEVILVDCLSFWVANLFMDGIGEEEILGEVEGVVKAAKGLESVVVIVSNEVGCGVVPASKSGRAYRDVLGRANQVVAGLADEVYLLAAGIPLKLKG